MRWLSLRRREANGGLEAVATVLAMPKVAHTAGIEIFRPFRDEQLLAALSTFERRAWVSEICGSVRAKFHDFLHEDASRTIPTPVRKPDHSGREG